MKFQQRRPVPCVLPDEKHAEHCNVALPTIPELFVPKGLDPELLYVECGRCGAPVIWEKGRATTLLNEAGIDPIELDESCFLVTDACPMCSTQRKQYTVQIFRVSNGVEIYSHYYGNA